MLLVIALLVGGCGKTPVVQTTLSVQETQWSEQGSSTDDPVKITPLQKGDVVYDDHFTKITVRSVDEEKIVLAIDGYMVEPSEDGTIDLSAEPLKKIRLECGQTMELVSQSMSAGFNLLLSYEN